MRAGHVHRKGLKCCVNKDVVARLVSKKNIFQGFGNKYTIKYVIAY